MRRIPRHPGERIDRSKTIQFKFDGRRIAAHPGDTYGSALAAAGVTVLSRSFKYHRPRGLACMTGGCPNCLVDVDGVPSVRSCTAPARDGAVVTSQNAFPHPSFDVLRVNDWVSFLLPVGFYYKIFARPRGLWHLVEPVIRRVAGLGRLTTAKAAGDPPKAGTGDHKGHDHGNHVPEADPMHRHCDVAVVGGGPAGMEAALAAAKEGKSVVLVEREPVLGGHLCWEGATTHAEAEALAARVAAERRIEVLLGAEAFGLYEGNLLTVAQPTRLWKIRAGEVVVATGRAARHVVFAGNDLPGVMTGVAVRRLIRLYGVAPGRRAVVVAGSFACADLTTALEAAGVEVAHVARWPGQTVVRAEGGSRVTAAVVADVAADGSVAGSKRVACDLVVLEAGWDPVAQPAGQAGCAFTPGKAGDALWPDAATLPRGVRLAGEVTGEGAGPAGVRIAPADPGGKRFVCLCEDVTEQDVAHAIAEGFGDIEMLKRYTTVAMGPCQGRVCSAAAAALCSRYAAATGGNGHAPYTARPGITTLRPPAAPVALAVLGADRHHLTRRTPMHHVQDALGAVWMDLGEWKRPYSYGDAAAEVRAVRGGVGIIDLSTLGRLWVEGADAPALLDFAYTHRFSDLKAGRTRYGVLCDDAGVILDDGTVTRVSETAYFITTSSGNVQFVEQWLKWWGDTKFSCVHVVNVTAGYAAVNVAGPRAREVLTPILEGADLSNAAFPYMASREAKVAGVACRMMRIGFVGETGWEIHYPADEGEEVWAALLHAGRPAGIVPFGIEAQRILRLEKKHVIIGVDTDGLSNPIESDMAWAVKFDKPDFVGKAALLEVKQRPARQHLVGWVSESGPVPPDGSAIVVHDRPRGRVTSSRRSPTLGKTIGMAWVAPGCERAGTPMVIPTDRGAAFARVFDGPFYDPAGERMKS